MRDFPGSMTRLCAVIDVSQADSDVILIGLTRGGLSSPIVKSYTGYHTSLAKLLS
jgi:hypothetical protein